MHLLRRLWLKWRQAPEIIRSPEPGFLPDHPPLPSWRGLYVAALFETDKQRMAQRIADAERALVVRARELFQATGDNLEEESAIDDALFALHTLEHCTGADARPYAQRQA